MTTKRKLTPQEIALFPSDFINQIKIDDVQLISRAHNIFAKNKILVRGNKIYWPNCPKDFTKESIDTQSMLMHELCHVWQYHHPKELDLRICL